jgi:hypothetical protein
LWLQGVAALVANDGFFTQGAETAPKPRRSMVKRGALLGATLMFIGTPLILTLMPYGWKRGPELIAFFFYWVALIAFIGVSGYLKRLITKIFNIFSEEESSPSKKIASPRGPTLPAAYSAPVSDPDRQFVATAKVAQPSSVTEQTTSRLNNM